MATLTPPDDWRWGFRHSRMVCLIWSDAPQHAATLRAKLAYAQALGKPIRLLVLGATRLPEDLWVVGADVQIAQVASEAEATRQIQAWLTALEER